VGVTWNIRGGTNLSLVQVYIDGALSTGTRGTTTGTLPALGTLYIGDNRSSGVTPSNGTGNSANGIIDEFYVYAIDVSGPQIQADMNLTRATCTTLDHFHIIHNGNATCGVANVTIEAHDLNHVLFSLSGTTMSVSTSTGHGSWSAVTAINPVVNTAGGTATYTFANESRVVFALTDPYTETVNINVASGNITEHSFVAASCSAPDYTYGTVCDADLVFGPCVSSFECVANGLAYNNLVANPSARNPLYTQLAATAFSVDVLALDAAGNRVTSYAADADKTVTVELVTGSGATACASRTSRAATTLTFTKTGQPTDQGRKTVGFTVANAYPDLLCRVTDANMTPNVVACSSDHFAIRPKTFTVTAALGGATLKAGHDFTLTAASGVTAAYQGAPTLDTTKLRDHNAAPAGTLTGSFAAGDGAKAVGTFQYHDVGTIALLADAVTDTGFTAVDQPSDCVVGSTSNTPTGGQYGCSIGSLAAGPFGRFYPDHFTYTTTLTPACNGFTYMDQPKLGINLQLAAKSLNEATTLRYTSGYGFLGTFAIVGDNAGAAVAVSRLTPALPAFAWSAGTYAVSSATTGFARNAAPDGTYENFALKANILTEPDGVAIAGTNLSNTSRIRFGRLRLSNVYGYASPLQMPVEAQYWSGNSWVKNGDDNCTALANGNLLMSPAGWTRTAPGTLAGGAGIVSLIPTGAGTISLCADLGADNGVACAATSAGLPWLQSRWPGGAQYNNDPGAIATFGIFSPEGKRGLYNREMY
jgi:MSHA biogenesis protein MshQ